MYDYWLYENKWDPWILCQYTRKTNIKYNIVDEINGVKGNWIHLSGKNVGMDVKTKRYDLETDDNQIIVP